MLCQIWLAAAVIGYLVFSAIVADWMLDELAHTERNRQMPTAPNCPTCGQELEQFDVIINKTTDEAFSLWICKNEDCDDCSALWNDAQPGFLNRGDPSGIY